MKTKTIDYESLAPEEVDELPESVRIRLKGALKEGGEWFLVRSSWPLSGLVRELNRLGEIRAEHVWPVNSTSMLSQLAWLLAADLPSTEKDLVYDNLTARTEYLDRTPVLTAAEIHSLSGLGSRNQSEPASRWQKEGKTFGIRVGQPYLFPAFQFLDGRPREGLSEILAALPRDITPWQKAFWFASGNGWLDGDKPEQRLDDVSKVVDAARRLTNLAHG